MNSMNDQINDCFVDAYRRAPNNSEIQTIVKILPVEIISLAKKWSWDDTEVRDALFGYIKKLKAEGIIK
ncbi:hypothetical protein P9G40_18915 [Bacillus velezensis]|uniref:hypothetical protein n=1 Tax=Bacillus velezensis TaxID=492670 RepID=UPI002DBB3600|nr:hypothetical protein [Bacillus velezensis]MEC1943155.1 hypothetical protein [Bacillus velezensis]MEC2153345.1 hypothetical protein [Bacillus velezensis]MEC2157216.1 hypothetical protein [Bacillus velezensis]